MNILRQRVAEKCEIVYAMLEDEALIPLLSSQIKSKIVVVGCL